MRIEYKASVAKDLRRLDASIRARVIERIQQQLSDPALVHQPLNGEYTGLFKLRVGDYRAIYSRSLDTIVVMRVGHRSEAYR